MKYETVDFKTHLESYRYAVENKKKYNSLFPNTFLEHSLPILASIPIIRNDEGKVSPSLIEEHFKTCDTMIKTPNGEIHKNNLYYLLAFLYEVPRSRLSTVAQNKAPRLGSLTPLPMYAHKLYNNIGYDEWDYNDDAMRLYLGNFLQQILPLTRKGEPVTNVDVAASRQISLTYVSGAKAGEMAPLTTYKVRPEVVLEDESHIELPRLAVIMLLQTWLAHSSIRNTESMILDPWNWGTIPDPLDAVASSTIVTSKPSDSYTASDTPWSH